MILWGKTNLFQTFRVNLPEEGSGRAPWNVPGGRSRTSSGPWACTCLVLAEQLGQVLTPRPHVDVTLIKLDSLWGGPLSPAVLSSNHSTAGPPCLRPPPSHLLLDGAETPPGQIQPPTPQHRSLVPQQASQLSSSPKCAHTSLNRTFGLTSPFLPQGTLPYC